MQVLTTPIACELVSSTASFSARAMFCSSLQSSIHRSSIGVEDCVGIEGELLSNAEFASAPQISSMKVRVGVPSMTARRP